MFNFFKKSEKSDDISSFSKREQDIIRHIKGISTELISGIYKTRFRDTSYRYHFWWNSVHSKIRVKDWQCIMPKFLGALDSLHPSTLTYNEYHMTYDNVEEISGDNILFLQKKDKKRYIKPEILTDGAKYIAACLSGTDIKYLYYGKSNKRDDLKLYLKEIKAFEDAGFKLVKENARGAMVYKDKYHYSKPGNVKEMIWCTDCRLTVCTGYLFELPELSKEDAEKIYRDLRNKRLKELHINYLT